MNKAMSNGGAMEECTHWDIEIAKKFHGRDVNNIINKMQH